MSAQHLSPKGTDHSQTIAALYEQHGVVADMAADLLDLHDRTGISLDGWPSAQAFIALVCDENEVPFTFQRNGA